MNFKEFKNCEPTLKVLEGLGLSECVSGCVDWYGFTKAVVGFNDQSGGRLVEDTKQYANSCSSGERVLLSAILYAADFSGLADNLDEGNTWRHFNRVSGLHRQAVVACIARQD